MVPDRQARVTHVAFEPARRCRALGGYYRCASFETKGLGNAQGLGCYAASWLRDLLVLSGRGFVPRPVRRKAVRRLGLSTRQPHITLVRARCRRVLRCRHLGALYDPQVS